jgi:hypothetical protein
VPRLSDYVVDARDVASLMEFQARLGGGEPTATRAGARVPREGEGEGRDITSGLAGRDLGARFRSAAETVSATGTWYRRHGMLPAGAVRASARR